LGIEAFFSKMAFVPPFFSKFGKSYSDLSGKKYDYANTVKVTSKTTSAPLLNFESTGYLNESSITGTAKVVHNDPTYGECTVEVDSSNGNFKTQFKNTQLVDGATITVAGGYKVPKAGCSKTGFYGSLNSEYSQDMFAAETSLTVSDKTAPASPGVDFTASGVIGVQGMSVGGGVTVNASASKLSDYNLGIQYQNKEFTGTLKTADCADTINASWYHNVSNNQLYGLEFSTNPFKGSKLLTLATQYQVDVDTTVKGKLNSNGVLAAAVETRLQNPKLKYNLAAEFNAVGAGIPKASRFGIGMEFGQY
jgi:hypothetical protein